MSRANDNSCTTSTNICIPCRYFSVENTVVEEGKLDLGISYFSYIITPYYYFAFLKLKIN
jgi:hypothetical protein